MAMTEAIHPVQSLLEIKAMQEGGIRGTGTRSYRLTAKLFLAGILMASTVSPSYAWTECELHVEKVWQRLEGTDSVGLRFQNASGSIYKTATQVTESQMERLLSIGATAVASGKPVIVRFPDNNLNCSTALSSSRSDIEGIWLSE